MRGVLGEPMPPTISGPACHLSHLRSRPKAADAWPLASCPWHRPFDASRENPHPTRENSPLPGNRSISLEKSASRSVSREESKGHRQLRPLLRSQETLVIV